MPDDYLGAEVGEARAEATNRLRRERDFRYEEDRRAAFGHDLTNQRHVDLGLTRAGDTMEQVRTKGLRVERLRDRGDGGDLLRIQRVTSRGDRLPFGIRVVIGDPPEHAGVFLNRARLDEGIHGLLGDTEAVDHLRTVSGLLLAGKIIDHLRLARGLLAKLRECFGFGRGDERQQSAEDRTDALAHRSGQDGLQHGVQSTAVVARHPFG